MTFGKRGRRMKNSASFSAKKRQKIVKYFNSYEAHDVSNNGVTSYRRVSKGGGIWGMCPPPLEPNAQRKNLRRLKDLRGPIQQKLSKWYIFFFAKDFLLKFTLQFVIRKNVICERKVCLPPPMRLLFLV